MAVALNSDLLFLPFTELFTLHRLKRPQLSGWCECVASPWWWFNLSEYPECAQLRCANGACYNRTQRCDHVLDCRDGSDEANCSKKPVDHWALSSLSLCSWPNARVSHFLLVFFVSSLAQHCNTGQFQCRNELCVPQRYVCDHDDDCGDRSDELNCSMSLYLLLFSSPALLFMKIKN